MPTVAELKGFCREQNKSGYSRLRKAELISYCKPQTVKHLKTVLPLLGIDRGLSGLDKTTLLDMYNKAARQNDVQIRRLVSVVDMLFLILSSLRH